MVSTTDDFPALLSAQPLPERYDHDTDVLCLRPEADFTRVDAPAPPRCGSIIASPTIPTSPDLMREADALHHPGGRSQARAALFEGTRLKLVQVTGTGSTGSTATRMVNRGIPVANVAGGSNSALAEYAVTTASLLLRRFAWADAEIKSGNYAAFRARMVADNLAGIEGLTVGLVGFGAIGFAVAQAFHRMGCRICYYDPALRDPESGGADRRRAMTLDALLATSDVVSLHVPLLPETHGV